MKLTDEDLAGAADKPSSDSTEPCYDRPKDENMVGRRGARMK